MRKQWLTAGAALSLLIMGSSANASPVTYNFSFNVAGTIGQATLTTTPSPSAGLPDGDPANASSITAASGTITNLTLGFNNVAITGVVALNHAAPPPHEDLIESYSANFYDSSNPAAGAFSYDNLYYPQNDSPVVCPPFLPWITGYPFSGGYLDTFGVLFTLSNGDYAGVWSNGDIPHVGLTYGVNLIHPEANGTYRLLPSVPEPGTTWLLAAGLLGLLGWARYGKGMKAKRLG